MREEAEQAQDAATAALNALRHACGDSWEDWAATVSAASGAAAHAYIRGREAWQPAVVRRGADLKLTGRTDCIIARHTQTLTEYWCRDDIAHHTDALITDALAAYPKFDALPPLTPAQLRASAFDHHTTKAPDGFHVRHFRILNDKTWRSSAPSGNA